MMGNIDFSVRDDNELWVTLTVNGYNYEFKLHENTCRGLIDLINLSLERKMSAEIVESRDDERGFEEFLNDHGFDVSYADRYVKDIIEDVHG